MSRNNFVRFVLVVFVTALAAAQSPKQSVTSGKRYPRMVVRNAMVVDGNGTPASGPKDIVIENDTIAEIVPLSPAALDRGGRNRPAGDVEIDAAGKYVLPGLINAHAHIQEERGGVPQPLEYELNLWLACGITMVRDVGSDTKRALELRRLSNEGKIAAPRIFVYPFFGRPPAPRNAEQARARVREYKEMGADGIKALHLYRDVMAALLDEAHKAGLRVAHHAGVEETNAWDDIKFGTTTIEHWYGIPDAAIEGGVQNFPAGYNYNDESDRFRYAGRLWREANWERLMKVLDGMVQANVAWDPTLDIYEASRDLQRAQTQPWFAEYLHPTLEEFFRPNAANHGSYFNGWTSTDEALWKENYRLWMAALREFDRRGGLIRGMELHQEAGFHPLKIIQQATGNNAKILGQEDRLGRIRVGYKADLIVVNGNPLENLKVLYPTGVEEVRGGKVARTGGIEWTIKDGIPYHGPTLMAEVKEMVAKARAERARKVSREVTP